MAGIEDNDPLNRDARRQRITTRGKNFSAADDRNICIAWLAISNDPLKGRDQMGDGFWKEIQEHARVKKRSYNAIRQRWGLISRCVMKFIDCYTAANNRANDGTLVGSVYDEAIELYMKRTNSKKWPFSECYEILRNSPKFNHYHQLKTNAANANHQIMVSQQSQPSSFTNSTENYDTKSNIEDGMQFFGDFHSTSDTSIHYGENGLHNGFAQPNDPFDSREELEHRRVEALEALAKAAQEKNQLFAEYIGAMNAATDAKYVTQPTNNLDPLSLQILELKKVKILTELQKTGTIMK